MEEVEATYYSSAVSMAETCPAISFSNFASRVLNTFKSMITDEDILESQDMYILGRMRDFVTEEEVNQIAAAKQLLTLIERYVSVLNPRVYGPCLMLLSLANWGGCQSQNYYQYINKCTSPYYAQIIEETQTSGYRPHGNGPTVDDHGE